MPLVTGSALRQHVSVMDHPGALELAYLPIDRWQALARGEELPARAHGAVLFADVSGFTSTTERLAAALGPQRGAEALTQILDAVYAGLVAEVHAYRGSVISFAGDAITCFFADDDGQRALACGLAMHRALPAVRAGDLPRAWRLVIELKVAVSVGEVRRFSAGDPAIQLLDILAGAPLAESAAIERDLRPGETGVGPGVAAALGAQLIVDERRTTIGGDLVIVHGVAAPVLPSPWPAAPPLAPELTRPWLLRHVRKHMAIERGKFLGELRLCTVMFARLGELGDPDADLGASVTRAQRVIDRHGGVLAQVVVGDKGSYFYAVFGAPVAHEDDAARALAAAWELLRSAAGRSALAFGISQGQTYAGAYGSPQRRTYGILGPEVNTAARLMAEAAPGTILVTARVARVASGFRVEPVAPLHLKGLGQPLLAFRAVGRESRRPTLTRGVRVVGRDRERAQLTARLDALVAGESGVVILEGEPGIGKSSLLTELVERAEDAGLTTLVGFGEAIEAGTPYHAWRSVLAELLGATNDPRSAAALSSALADPELGPLLPLANAVLPLGLPETEATASLVGDRRANLTRGVVARWLARELGGRPLVLVLEDVHWLDSASWALALMVRFELAPLLLVLATRPIPEPWPRPYRQLVDDPACLHLRLTALEPPEILALVAAGLGVDELPAPVAAWIGERGGGHPFFSQELAYALRDAGLIEIAQRRCHLTPRAGDLGRLAFPATIQGVIASRIDLLAPTEQLTLKVASVVGRVFTDAVLRGVYPIEADAAVIDAHLAAFAALDLTRLDAPPPAPRHAFRHAVTHEIVYDLLLYAQRASLHRAIAIWLEGQAPDPGDLRLLPLAHHWERADEPARATEYLLRAGARSLAEGAYQEAIVALRRAITLEPACATRPSTHELARRRVLLGDALSRVGKLAEARELLLAALELLGRPYPATPRALAAAVARMALRQLARRVWGWGRTSQPPRSTPTSDASTVDALLARANIPLSVIAYTRNDRLAVLHAGLLRVDMAERTATPDAGELARGYAVMVLIAAAAHLGRLTGEYMRLARLHLEAATDREAAAWALQVLAIAALGDARLAEAQALFERARHESAEIGQVRLWEEVTAGYAHCLRHRGAWAEAEAAYEALYQRALRQGDAQAQNWGLANQAYVVMRRGDFTRARALVERARPGHVDPDAIGEAKRLCAAVLTELRAGDPAAAATALAELTPLIRAAPIAYNMLHAYLAASEYHLFALERRPDPAHRAAARPWLEQLERYARQFRIGVPTAAIHRARWLAAHPGSDRAIQRALDRALTTARMLGLPYSEAEAHLAAATLRPTAPESARHEHLTAARTIFHRLGATWDLAGVDALLARR